MSIKPLRRVVTGHGEHGQSVIIEDGAPARLVRVGGDLGPWFHELWNTRQTPCRIERVCGEPEEPGIQLAPPKNGTRIRVLDIPPEDERHRNVSAAEAQALFAEIGAAEASSHSTSGTRHPHMHRTQTIDYGIVLDGEITLILDEGETTVRAGDVVIQCGTNHGWANRSAKNCRILFVLIDGTFAPDIA
jgi:mannose-6-phosphate isomerase-like protein (cupin superfamily)